MVAEAVVPILKEASIGVLCSRAGASSVSDSSGSWMDATCSNTRAKSKSRANGLYSLPERSYASKGKM